MTTESTIREIATYVKDSKVDACKEDGGPADLPAVIFGRDVNGQPFILPDTMNGHPTDNLPIMLQVLSDGLDEKNSTMKWEFLAYVVEGYLGEPDGTPPERGALAHEYKTKADTKIKEAIIITLIMWDGESLCHTYPYRYGDDGLPMWDEEIVGDEAPVGLVPFIFETFRTFCHYEGDLSKLTTDNS